MKISGLQNKRSVERCAAHLVFCFSRTESWDPFRCSARGPQTLFTEQMRHYRRTHRGLQYSSIARRSHSLKYRSVGRGTQLRLPPSGQNWQVRGECVIWSPSAFGHARVHVPPVGAKDGHRQLSWKSCGHVPSCRCCSWTSHERFKPHAVSVSALASFYDPHLLATLNLVVNV